MAAPLLPGPPAPQQELPSLAVRVQGAGQVEGWGGPGREAQYDTSCQHSRGKNPEHEDNPHWLPFICPDEGGSHSFFMGLEHLQRGPRNN